MKKTLKTLICFASSVLLFSGCTTNVNPPKDEYTPFFKDIALDIESGDVDETTYYTFYEAGNKNRFYVELTYDLHFGLSLKIEEYDLLSFILYPNEGVVSSDYESITFSYTALEKTDLFSKGTYILSHNKETDSFSLKAASKNYSLSLTEKERPNYIYYDLVGEFAYIHNDETIFSMEVEVGEKSQGYPVSILLEEGDKVFVGSNVRNNGETSTFDISGEEDGLYLKNAKDVSFSFSEGTDVHSFTIDGNRYVLTKIEEEKKEELTGNYFIDNAEKLKFSFSDFEARLSYKAGKDQVFIIFKELVEDGNPNFWCYFMMTDESTIENSQTITSSKNKIFTGVSKYEFKHHVENNRDIVDLYFDGVLTYSDLTITVLEVEA